MARKRKQFLPGENLEEVIDAAAGVTRAARQGALPVIPVPALIKVGGTPQEMLSWLNDFAACDLNKRFPQLVGAEVECFMVRMMFPAELPAARSEQEADLLIAKFLPNAFPHGYESAVAPHVGNIQRELRRVFSELREKGETILVGDGIRLGLRWQRDDDKPALQQLVGGSPIAQFLFAVGQLLMLVHSELRLCDAPGCQRFFVATRPHQKRCSARCTNRVNAAKFREKHGDDEIADRRSDYYRRRRSRELGVRSVKIKRRPGVGGRKKKASGTA